jgi:GT2 family glycosyltransferase
MSAEGQPAPSPEISVVLSTLGSYETLEKVLDGYSAQSVPSDRFEVVLAVDAGETDLDAVGQAVGQRSFEVRQVRGSEPGLSANRNAGRRAARAPLVLFTDNDTIPLPRLLAEHLAWHGRHTAAEVGVVGLVRWAPGIKVTTFMRWLDTGIQFDYANMQPGEVGWGRFAGANVSMKRTFVETVGDFDQQHFPYGYEDTDWAYRASKHGLTLLYNPDAVVDHLREMSLDFWKKRARRVAAAEYQFCRMYPEMRPWFHRLFSEAAARPPARGRGARFAPYVPRQTPWLGELVWNSVDQKYRQEIAPHFLDAWDEAVAAGESSNQLDLSEWE